MNGGGGSIYTLGVQIQANTTAAQQFVTAAQNMANAANQFNNALKAMTQTQQSHQQATQQHQNILSSFAGLLGGVVSNAITKAAIQLEAFYKSLELVQKLWETFTESLKMGAELEAQTKRLEVLTGSAQVAGEMIKQLGELVDQAGGQFGITNEATRTMAARFVQIGIDADRVVPLMRGLSEWAATSNTDFGSLAETFLQIEINMRNVDDEMGRMTGNRMMVSLARQGIDVWGEFTKVLGYNRGVWAALAQAGAVTTEQWEKVVASIDRTKSMLAAQAETSKGLFATLKSGWEDVLEAFGLPIDVALSDALKRTVSWMELLKDKATAAGNEVAKWIGEWVAAWKAGKLPDIIAEDLKLAFGEAAKFFVQVLTAAADQALTRYFAELQAREEFLIGFHFGMTGPQTPEVPWYHGVIASAAGGGKTYIDQRTEDLIKLSAAQGDAMKVNTEAIDKWLQDVRSQKETTLKQIEAINKNTDALMGNAPGQPGAPAGPGLIPFAGGALSATQQAYLTAYTPGMGRLMMEGANITAMGTVPRTFEQYQAGLSSYVTGAVGPSYGRPTGAFVNVWMANQWVPVKLEDYGPGVKGIDIASGTAAWAKAFPYQGMANVTGGMMTGAAAPVQQQAGSLAQQLLANEQLFPTGRELSADLVAARAALTEIVGLDQKYYDETKNVSAEQQKQIATWDIIVGTATKMKGNLDDQLKLTEAIADADARRAAQQVIRFQYNQQQLARATQLAQAGALPDMGQAFQLGLRKASDAFGSFQLQVVNGVVAISQALSTGIAGGLDEILTGTKSVKDGFRDMALAVVRSIEQIITKMLVEMAIQMIINALVGGPAGGGFTTVPGKGIVPFRYATPVTAQTGGLIPGSGAGDRVPILGEPGEFIINKRSALRIGYARLMELNAMQAGGPVGGYTHSKDAMHGGAAVNVSVTVNHDGTSRKQTGNPDTDAHELAQNVERVVLTTLAKQKRFGGELYAPRNPR